VCVLAGGKYEGESAPGRSVLLKVAARQDDPDWSVAQSPFIRNKARTLTHEHELTLEGDRVSYFEPTVVDIYGSPSSTPTGTR
jgi:hypothetical protein